MSQSKNKDIPNKLVYKGHLYRRADTLEGVMWDEFGELIQRLSQIANSKDFSTTEKANRGRKLFEEIRFYANQVFPPV